MNRVHAFSHLICVLSVATLFQFQSAEAQIFEGTTINSGTIYDSQGFGTYDLSGGSLTLDGSSVFGDGTTIQWDAPISGGTLQFEPTLLTTTGGDLSLTGNQLPPQQHQLLFFLNGLILPHRTHLPQME